MATISLHLGSTQYPHIKLKPPKLTLRPRSSTTSCSHGTVNGHPENNVHVNNSNHLHPSLQKELMPRHVAVIMDGNRRWARDRNLPLGSGYEAGLSAFRRVAEMCSDWGIRVLTVFAFSSDNWFRPKAETDFLMGLLEMGLRNELQHFMRQNIRLSVIGDTTKLPNSLQQSLEKVVKTTSDNSGLHLIMAMNYGGQNDLVQACQKLASKVKDGLLKPEDINESLIEKELETRCTDFPNPDLLIRTSGEIRISNFLLWQLAYTELYFADLLWPDFGEEEFVKALCSFQQRQRRYGRNL